MSDGFSEYMRGKKNSNCGSYSYPPNVCADSYFPLSPL